MGRPEPCVLFSQTFVHPQLDEYVDEVLFNESIVVTACEFIEQNASSASSVVTLVGATSPPSFALEVFAQCEGEPRFRRLCQPFLYSHSSSNMLEVEAIVTNHLVVRGSYRSLTLVVYGNTTEDLGQFNIEFDLDSSLANVVCSPSEGKFEDLPPALHSTKLTLEESILPPKLLSLQVAADEPSFEIEQFLHLIFRVCSASGNADAMHSVIPMVVSAVSSYFVSDLSYTAMTWDLSKKAKSMPCIKELQNIFAEAKNELEEFCRTLTHEVGEGVASKSEADVATAYSELLPDIFSWYYHFIRNCPTTGQSLFQTKSMIFGLSMALLFCSGRETCFHFVNSGGMEHLVHAFHHETQKSTAVTLMLLGVIERATRYGTGCEGFLGWWPRDEIVPVGNSEGYSQILKLLLQKQRHDVASLSAYLLHRLRFYEVVSKYESAVLSLLEGLPDVAKAVDVTSNLLSSVKLQLKKLLKLLNSRGPIKDPSPVASASSSLTSGHTEGTLSYKATIDFIKSSNCCFAKFDIDLHLLLLLKERGFLPVSAALLASSTLRSVKGHTLDLFMDIASLVEAILLSLLFCRSGLVFLLLQPEVASSLVHSLKGVEDTNMEDCVPLRYASVLINKGFFCRPHDIGMITELHLRVVNAVDRLLASTPQSEELLWVLWELCGISRSDAGRQALLVLGHFPEAVSVLMESLRSAKDLEPATLSNGSSPLNIAIFHSAAEIFEVIVSDSTASSLGAWIGHSVELHKALHSSSPGSNRKDAPTRLLEWIDAGVIYKKNGAIGLLRYAAVLASGGDAHLSSTSILVSDSMDVENVVGDSASGSDIQIIENLLGKLVSDKSFDGVILRDSSIAQLTTAFRILSFISENSSAAASLYEEGAVTLIYVVLINCKFMLERSSNTYDYLVDEGAECNSMSDLLSERGREQSLVDLMIPCLLLLNTLLRKLQEAKEQYRNTKLLKALLHLHREVSPKLAACAADLSSPYPGSALGLGVVCHLLVSALACWPVFGWTPGLFHCLLESIQATSSLALGPKEACSILCLLGDLFPEEGIWLWKNGMPSLSALKTLALATLLGPKKETCIGWYLEPGHVATLLCRLTPLLDKIAQIILHFSFTALVVMQDMLRVFIIRIACQKPDSAIILLRPIISWIHDHVSETCSLADTDVFKVYRLLEFLSSILEHPYAKTLLLKEGVISVLVKALEKCFNSLVPEGVMSTESKSSNSGSSLLNWCVPLFKSLALICDSKTPLRHPGVYDNSMKLSVQDCSLVWHYLLKLCQVLPVGKELLASLIAFKELASCNEGRSAFASISIHLQSPNFDEFELERGHDDFDWRRSPPLLYCWRNILRSGNGRNFLSAYAIEAIGALSSGALCLCVEGKSLNLESVAVLKFLFGLPIDLGEEPYSEDPLKDVTALIGLLDVNIVDSERLLTSDARVTLSKVKGMAKSLLLLLQKPSGLVKVDDIVCHGSFSLLSNDILDHFKFTSKTMRSIIHEDAGSLRSRKRKPDGGLDSTEDLFSFSGLADKFLWDCPDSLREKKRIPSIELPNRRPRLDNSGTEVTGPNAFVRGLVPPVVSSGPTRRDNFRQRKPNTSRPPSMHVDDYVARERNVDGGSIGSNVMTSGQRGVTGGRPPSIHVDEFMARQRERQVSVAMVGGEVAPAQTRNVPAENDRDPDKVDRSRQLKAALDDDLQEINIVFDGDESESDDRLPFPQPDDNLQPAPALVEGSSPQSIVEETENDANGSTHVSDMATSSASVVDENAPSEFFSRRSSRPELPLSREPSISSEKKFVNTEMDKPIVNEKSVDAKHYGPLTTSNGFDSATTNFSEFPPQFHKGSTSSRAGDARMSPSNFYQRDIQQHARNIALAPCSQGLQNQKHLPTHPPLPPTPPPPNVSCVPSQNAENVQSHSTSYGHNTRDMQPPLPPGFPSKAFEVSGSVSASVYNVREDRSTPRNYAVGSNPASGSSSFLESPNDPSVLQHQTDYLSTFNSNSSTVLGAPHTMFDSKYSRSSVVSATRFHEESNSSTGGLARSQPPLPPTPPPFSASLISQSSAKSKTSHSPGYNQTTAVNMQLPSNSSSPATDARMGNFSASGGNLTSYSPPQLVPPLLTNRPISVSLFSSPTIYQGQSLAGVSHNVSTPQPSIVSMQPRLQLQPLQPPQPPHPHPHHLRPPMQVSQQQSELSLLQSPIQVQSHPFQIHQQSHISPIHVYYSPQQHENLAHAQQPQQVELSQPQALQQHGNIATQQQQDVEMSLQQYFSPDAIQSLISDREKLCEILEQNPKLMQMLQERLGP